MTLNPIARQSSFYYVQWQAIDPTTPKFLIYFLSNLKAVRIDGAHSKAIQLRCQQGIRGVIMILCIFTRPPEVGWEQVSSTTDNFLPELLDLSVHQFIIPYGHIPADGRSPEMAMSKIAGLVELPRCYFKTFKNIVMTMAPMIPANKNWSLGPNNFFRSNTPH